MVEVSNISKRFESEQVLRDISFELDTGQTLSILGKSGCGKSTLLKILAGIELPDSGRFEIGGKVMFQLPAQNRGVVYLSQEPLLFPHLNVYKNLAFGLEVRKEGSKLIDIKTKEMAEKLGLSAHLDKLPHQLSGGQKQRANFGRALIINPAFMLLDEPFGSLDSQMRNEMQQLFIAVRQSIHLTALFVTHDVKEALLMGNKIATMAAGKLKVFDSMQAFIQDPTSGVQKEIDFWNNINHI